MCPVLAEFGRKSIKNIPKFCIGSISFGEFYSNNRKRSSTVSLSKGGAFCYMTWGFERFSFCERIAFVSFLSEDNQRRL